MSDMRISLAEQKIISSLQLNADLPLAELCKKAGLKAHTVHYHLRRLKEQGVIRRGVFLNLPALGFEQYGIYFSLAPLSAKDKLRLLRELRQHPRVFWFAELGGDFQYGMSIIARHPGEAFEFIGSLSAKGESQILRKAVSQIVNLSIFPKKYLSSKSHTVSNDTLELVRTVAAVQLDSKDYQILGELVDGQGESIQNLAKRLGLPRTTIEYRIKRLMSAQILLKSIYYVSAAKLGLQSFKLLLYARSADNIFERQLFRFAEQHRQIVFYCSNLGSWDFELSVEALSTKEAVAVTESIYEQFGNSIQEIRILPVFEQTTSSGFLKI
jgi:DNA-binding Lrp family transcriptional regulator